MRMSCALLAYELRIKIEKVIPKASRDGCFFMPGINMCAHVQMGEMDMRAHVHSVK